jgi:hypothetical protein
MWNCPPNILLVDFYDFGLDSVFEITVRANGVTYSRKCYDVWSNSNS